MIAAARTRSLDARLMNAAALTFDREFDAVFSNAALHWIHDADGVLAGVARALKRGGRFVAEFGGHGNVAAIAVAVRAVLDRRGVSYEWPWYYPTAAEYRARLEAHQFRVEDIALIPRPTSLPTGMDGWLETFAASLLSVLPPGDRERAKAEIVELLHPSLCDFAGNWTADYVRLQVVARSIT
jgi:SAM-dependent methyltransferase